MIKRMVLWWAWVLFLASGIAWAVPAHLLTPDMARLSSFGSVDFTQELAAKFSPSNANGQSGLHAVSWSPSDLNGMRLGGRATGLNGSVTEAFATPAPRRSGSHVQASIAAGGGLPLLVNVDPNNPQAPRLVPAFGEPASLTFLGIGLLISARFLRKKRRNLGV
jgi:hypothetical protein